nr:hypothetical protein Iba_chr06aCG6270 [Ipomoea batatas]
MYLPNPSHGALRLLVMVLTLRIKHSYSVQSHLGAESHRLWFEMQRKHIGLSWI